MTYGGGLYKTLTNDKLNNFLTVADEAKKDPLLI
jgi:hypothetical protein